MRHGRSFPSTPKLLHRGRAHWPDRIGSVAFKGVAVLEADDLTADDSLDDPDFTRYHSYINALGMLAYTKEQPITRLQPLRPEKQDVGNDPIRVRTETGDRFGMKDFSHGMGQAYYHVEGRDEKKFFTAEGYDISQPDRLTHLNQTAVALASTDIGAPFVVADSLLVIDGQVVKRSDGAWPPSWASETLAAATVYDATVAGSQAFAGVNSTSAPIYVRASGGTTWSPYQTGGAVTITLDSGACTALAWLKDRLMCVGGTASRSIYEVTGSDDTPSAIRSLLAGWQFTKPFEAGGFIYCLAQEASNARLSKLYCFGLNDAGTAIVEKGSQDFPKDTVVYCGVGYLDAILMAGGVRNSSGGYDPVYLFGQANDNGVVSWVIEREEKGSTTTDLSVRSIESVKRSVYMGWSTKAASYGLYAREGLAVHHLARGAFCHHVRKVTTAATPARVVGIATYKERMLFSVSGDGLYYENLSTPVTQAELITSIADWDDSGFKVWDTIDASYDALPASTSVTVDYSNKHPEDATYSAGLSDAVADSTGKTQRLSGIKERRFVLRVRSNASGASSPTVRSFSVRSNPSPDEPEWRLVRYFRLLAEDRKDEEAVPNSIVPDDVREALMDLSYSWVTLTEPGISYTAYVDDVSMLEPAAALLDITLGEPQEQVYIVQMSMLGVRN